MCPTGCSTSYSELLVLYTMWMRCECAWEENAHPRLLLRCSRKCSRRSLGWEDGTNVCTGEGIEYVSVKLCGCELVVLAISVLWWWDIFGMCHVHYLLLATPLSGASLGTSSSTNWIKVYSFRLQMKTFITGTLKLGAQFSVTRSQPNLATYGSH